MTITVMDEDVGTDDKVGSTVIKLASLCINGGLDEWYQCFHKGKNCGSIHLRGHFTAHGISAHPAGASISI